MLILTLMVVLVEIGARPILSVATAIIGGFAFASNIYTIASNVYRYLPWRLELSSKRYYQQELRQIPRSVAKLHGERLTDKLHGEQLTMGEYIEWIKSSPEWLRAGTRGYYSLQVAALRTLRRLFTVLVPEWVLAWGYRELLVLSVLSYLWLVLAFGRMMEALLPIKLPDTLQTLMSALQVPSLDSGLPLLILLSGLIVLAAMSINLVESESTCKYCRETFALENKGTYYHLTGKHTITEVVDGEQRSGTKYDGVMLLRCTNDDCGEPEIRETFWKEELSRDHAT